MYEGFLGSDCDFCGLEPVHSPADVAFLVKESEVLTGRPGRRFVIAGAERLHYRVHLQPGGYRVHRLDDNGKPTSTHYMLAQQLTEHSLGEAMRDGFLFTPVVGRGPTGARRSA